MPHTHKTWIVIADGEHARFLTAGAAPHFHTMETFRGHAAGGDHWTHGDPHAAAKHKFAALLAARVDTLAATETFDDLILVAPAHVMADLRAHLGKAATAKLKTIIQKDLTKVPDGDLAKHFPDWPLVLAA